MAEQTLEILNAEIVAAGSVRGWWNIAKKSRGKSAAPSASGNIGASRFPDSAIPAPAFIFWAWPPRPTARIAPAACSPAIAREIFFTARSTAQDSPTSHIRSTAATACNSAAPTSARLYDALRPPTSRCHQSCKIAAHILKPNWRCCARARSWRSAASPCAPTWRCLMERGVVRTFAAYPFRHGAVYKFPGDLPRLFLSYHPSQQNTFTGKLTPAMMSAVLRRIRKFLG